MRACIMQAVFVFVCTPPKAHPTLSPLWNMSPLLQGTSKANAFSAAQMDIARDARLTGKERAMKLATKTLARALRRQIEVSTGML